MADTINKTSTRGSEGSAGLNAPEDVLGGGNRPGYMCGCTTRTVTIPRLPSSACSRRSLLLLATSCALKLHRRDALCLVGGLSLYSPSSVEITRQTMRQKDIQFSIGDFAKKVRIHVVKRRQAGLA